MNDVIRFPLSGIAAEQTSRSGRDLLSVLGYDPHLPRCIEAIKHTLLDGRPAVIRLHAAANYPTSGDEKYQIDQEGQAVLVVGYDETNDTLAIIDPFQRSAHQSPQVEWISISEFEITMVDSSKGSHSSPGRGGRWSRLSENTRTLSVEFGFPRVKGTIMDHDVLSIENVVAAITVHHDHGTYQASARAIGSFTVDNTAKLEFDLPDEVGGNLSIETSISADLQGIRPYEYRDTLNFASHQEFYLPHTVLEREVAAG